MLSIKHVLLACPLLLTVACSTPSISNSNTSIEYHETINLKGRLSVRYQQNGKEEALHGSFTWSQNPQQTQVSLFSPLGQTLVNILLTPTAATLQQAGQTARIASDIDTLTRDTLGWSLPVAGLRTWLQGFASRADGSRFIASPEADSVTTNDGWQIRYVSWQGRQPKRIDLEHPLSDSIGAVAIRIIIDNE